MPKISFRWLSLFFIFYILLSVSLFLYSFTQVDLGLTLTKISTWRLLETSFQHIGYFQRPFSSQIFLFIVFFMSISYLILLYFSYKKKIGRKQIWALLLASTIILTFSYNAFSHDLFNYIFDAKVLTHYHQNPYFHKALDYPSDPMLSFMHWTHRNYPYGPLWLLITAPLTLIGGNIFLLTFFLFKILISSFFSGSVFMIEKIARTVKHENSIFALIFFAFNPLVIIESLVSSHNDIVMIFFILLGIYFLIKKRVILAFIFIGASGLVKFLGFALIPAFIVYVFNSYKNLNFSFNKLILSCLFLTSAFLVYVLSKMELQPWYLLWLLPFIALLRPNRYLLFPAIIISCIFVSTYSIFLFDGNWDRVAPAFKINLVIGSVVVSVVLVFVTDQIRRLTRN